MKILITGATGLLGRALIQLPQIQKHQLIIASRKRPVISGVDFHWMAFDLNRLNQDLDLSGIDVIIHLASETKNYSLKADLQGTRTLIEKGKSVGIKHFIFISIIGVDQLPVKYFRIKRQVELLVENSEMPYSILRATQFFEFFEQEIKKYLALPIGVLPGAALYQPIEKEQVAKKICTLIETGPQNKIVELGGIQILRFDEAAKIWLKFKAKQKWTLNIPLSLLGKLGKALSSGALTSTNQVEEGLSWEQWLSSK